MPRMKKFTIAVPTPTELVYEVKAANLQSALKKIGTELGDSHPDIDYVQSYDGAPEWEKAFEV